MQIELIEIRDHLNRFPPFDALPEGTLDEIAQQVEIAYFKAGTDILSYGAPIEELHYIRSGAVEIYRRNGELYNRLAEGEVFGQFGLLRGHKVRLPARAIEDSLIYFIPGGLFEQLCEAHDAFADFVEAEGVSRLKPREAPQGNATELMSTEVRKLITRRTVSVPLGTSVQDAARMMTEHAVSSLVIFGSKAAGDSGPTQIMAGITTDRDLRTRVLAEGLALDTPVDQVMSPDPITIQAEDSVFEAMLCMLRNNIHHLPVVHRQRPVGVINLSDIIRYESQSSLYLVNNIFNRQSVTELKALLPDLRATFLRLVNEQANAHMIGSAISGIGRSLTQRLLELAEQELGPPPVPYCFLALGSMARDEQLIVTDQDNALVLDNRFDPRVHDEYFIKLASFVSDGLAACGHSYC
jgi:CBS domain-containing protein